MERISACNYVYELRVLFTDRYITYYLVDVDVRNEYDNGTKLFGGLEHNVPTFRGYVCNRLMRHLKEQRDALEKMLFILLQENGEQGEIDEHATQIHFFNEAIGLLATIKEE